MVLTLDHVFSTTLWSRFVKYHWLLSKLMGYQFSIQYKTCKSNWATYALSYLLELLALSLGAISTSDWGDVTQIRQEVARDPELQRVIQGLT